jgi:hypothetical protein
MKYFLAFVTTRFRPQPISLRNNSRISTRGGLDSYGCHNNARPATIYHRGPLAGQSFAAKDEMLRQLNAEKYGSEDEARNESRISETVAAHLPPERCPKQNTWAVCNKVTDGFFERCHVSGLG